jgi:hypothetical protein
MPKHKHIIFVLSDITIVSDVVHLWVSIEYKVSSISSFTLIIAHIYGSIITLLFTTFPPLHFFFCSPMCKQMCASYMLKGEILSFTCRFFCELKFCASKGAQTFSFSRRAVYARSTDGMSCKNSLSLSLFRSCQSNP